MIKKKQGTVSLNAFVNLIENQLKLQIMIALLTWTSIFAGGFLVLMLLLSIFGGLDMDVDIGDTEVDADGGGLGIVKGFLTFLSVASWVMKILLGSEQNPAIAACIGVVAGLVAFYILSKLFKLLLRNEENVNWTINDALFSTGEVYLRIPEDGNGLVNVTINGVTRELKAKTDNNKLLPTGTPIAVTDIEGDYVIVQEKEENH